MRTNPVSAAFEVGDHDWICGWLCGRGEVAVDVDWVRRQLGLIHRPAMCYGWSDGTWWMWWKNRLEEAGLLKVTYDPPAEVCFLTTLHTGGTWYSTPEEMARLVAWADLPHDLDTTATPAIRRTLTKPEPIDATAARVTNYHRESQS